MSYAFSGKLAGLGDASSAYAGAMVAYQNDHAAWLTEKAAYDRAVQGFAANSAGQASSYASGMAAYQHDLALWNAALAARARAVALAQSQQRAIDVARDRANTAARAAGVVLPAGYHGCASQAQHNAWQADCARLSEPVKGLGADPTGPACALALLPVCQPAVPMPGALPPAPVPPAKPPPLTPPPTLRPEPQPPQPPPASSSVPQPQTGPFSVPTPTTASTIPGDRGPSPDPASDPSKSAGLIKNGLILVVLAVGGYAAYRTFKKPKAS